MSLNTTEVIGFCDQVNQLLQDNKTFLKDEGFDVENWIPEIARLKSAAVTKDAEKDAAKAVSKTKTREADTARDEAYKKASARLDSAISAFGKSTPAGKEASRLRSSLTSKAKKTNNNQNNS
jgi:hypothetical protein